jgi:hypothetical protein
MRLAMFRVLVRFVPVLALVGGPACDTVDLGAPPADVNACRPSQQFFLDHVWPEYLSKAYGTTHCYDTRCHDGSGSGGSLVLTPPTSAGVVPLPPDWEKIYVSAAENTQCTNVRSSKLITRPDGETTHGGGKLIDPDGPEALIVEMWVTAQ